MCFNCSKGSDKVRFKEIGGKEESQVSSWEASIVVLEGDIMWTRMGK